MATPLLAIVIPCFNEARRLDFGAFTRYLESTSNVALIFVDDGSTDDTAKLLGHFCDEHKQRTSVIAHDKNLGKAEAVRTGMLNAHGGGAEFIGFMDADLATPLDEAMRIIAAFSDPDTMVAIGYRPLLPKAGIERDFLRRVLQWAHAGVCSVCLRHPFQDTQCGAKFFRNNASFADVFSTPFQARWLFDLEVLTRYQHTLGDQQPFSRWLSKVPLERWQERAGSHVNGSTYVGAMRELFRLMRQR